MSASSRLPATFSLDAISSDRSVHHERARAWSSPLLRRRSFDLNAQTPWALWTTAPSAFLKPDSHGIKRIASKFTKGFFGTVGQGLAKVELSSYSGTIRILQARLVSRAKSRGCHSSLRGPQSRVPILCLAGFMAQAKPLSACSSPVSLPGACGSRSTIEESAGLKNPGDLRTPRRNPRSAR